MSASLPPGSDYDRDFYAWLMTNAELLRQGRLSEIDAEHIAEELEDMGKSERRALESWLRVLILHLLKWQHQPTLRGPSWQQSMDNARDENERRHVDSSSLRPRLGELVAARYPNARKNAMRETGLPLATFPETCPFTLDQLLDEGWWPE
jgi:hypothetical protein